MCSLGKLDRTRFLCYEYRMLSPPPLPVSVGQTLVPLLDYCTTVFPACRTASAASPLPHSVPASRPPGCSSGMPAVPASGPSHLLLPLPRESQGLPPSPPLGLCSDVTSSVQPFLTPCSNNTLFLSPACLTPFPVLDFLQPDDHQADAFCLFVNRLPLHLPRDACRPHGSTGPPSWSLLYSSV